MGCFIGIMDLVETQKWSKVKFFRMGIAVIFRKCNPEYNSFSFSGNFRDSAILGFGIKNEKNVFLIFENFHLDALSSPLGCFIGIMDLLEAQKWSKIKILDDETRRNILKMKYRIYLFFSLGNFREGSILVFGIHDVKHYSHF